MIYHTSSSYCLHFTICCTSARCKFRLRLVESVNTCTCTSGQQEVKLENQPYLLHWYLVHESHVANLLLLTWPSDILWWGTYSDRKMQRKNLAPAHFCFSAWSPKDFCFVLWRVKRHQTQVADSLEAKLVALQALINAQRVKVVTLSTILASTSASVPW